MAFGFSSSKITDTDIIDTYVIHLIYDSLPDKTLANFRLEEIKNIYLESFREMFVQQFKKYAEHERVYGLSSSDIEKVKEGLTSVSLRKFPFLFMLTIRNDKIRGNERWVVLAENVLRLEQAEEKGIIQALDVVNTTVHNSKDTVLGKFENFPELLMALNFKKTASPLQLVSKASKEIKNLAESVLQ